MTTHPSLRKISNLRRPMFWLWIALTLVVAGYATVAAPFVAYFGADESLIAIVVPPTMLILVGIGFGWLVLYIIAKPRTGRRNNADEPVAHPDDA